MKYFSLLFTVIVVLLTACTGNSDYDGDNRAYYGSGVGLGSIIAVVISWSRNKSILWAIIHGLLGWLYVIYALLVKNKD